MAQGTRYQIIGDLCEKQIETDVATYLGWCTPKSMFNVFRLLAVNEQLTGADKCYDCGTAIYIQFKKSLGLKSVSIVPTSTRKRRSPLEDLRAYRAESELAENPTLYFQLRAKAKRASEFQHNALLEYEKPNTSRAIYVAPLHLDKKTYFSALFDPGERPCEDPFHSMAEWELHSPGRWVTSLQKNPVLRAHISIAPHEKVEHHNHFYAYSTIGSDISWHSPSIRSRESRRLSYFIRDFFRSVIQDPSSMVSRNELAETILKIGASLGYQGQAGSSEDSPIEVLGRHGRWLHKTYGIRQFILLGNSRAIWYLRRSLFQ